MTQNNHHESRENNLPEGDNFIPERTGSATCINVDGQSEYGQYDLTKEPTTSGTGDNPLAE